MRLRRTFAEFFKEKRIASELTLRQFCQKHGFDPGNISKLERGVFAAPQAEEKLEKYARALGLKKGSPDWIEFFDRAAVSNRNLGMMKLKNEAILDKLPVLFRTIDNKEMTEEKLNQIIELIKQARPFT